MIYGIGDLHLDMTKTKPMDIFGENWINHDEKIKANWINKVKEDDLVLIPGDSSWAMRIQEAEADLRWIDGLPGKKVMSKGNHDYWWESNKKLNELGLQSIFFLHNNSYKYGEAEIAGTRGWIQKDSSAFKEDDEKIYNRELMRLELSLKQMTKDVKYKIAMLHYPPFNFSGRPNDFCDILEKYNVDLCVYGHLHAEGHKYIIEGNINGVNYKCLSSDYIDFDLELLY